MALTRRTLCPAADNALPAASSSQSPISHPARRPAPSPGEMLSLNALDTEELAAIETHARLSATDAGYHPRNEILIATSLTDYEDLVGEPALAVAGARRGLCGPGPAGARVIWVAPAPAEDFLETLTHEYAHALLPLRDNHTLGWLAVHVAALAQVTSPAHASSVLSRCMTQYNLEPER